MAEATDPMDIEIVELKTGKSAKGTECFYVLGRFLSIKEASNSLPATEGECSPAERKPNMTESLQRTKDHQFQHLQVPIPISKLQHVTDLSVFKICEEGGFRAMVGNANQESPISAAEEPRPEPRPEPGPESRPEMDDLLFWSADISSEDTEAAKCEAYNNVRRVISSLHARQFEGEIKEQFANSPAFRKASRYGNFRFSFALSYLLEMYKDQHCGGGEPQLRILSTELHKEEIAHYIVVHSPSTSKFNDFPMVPTVQIGSYPPYFVYWMNKTLYWRPESTSDALHVAIFENGHVWSASNYNKFKNGVYSVWNHVIFAFHLPEGQLKIPIEDLLEHLTACEGDYPFLGGTPISKEMAEKCIQDVRKTHRYSQ
ncbi:uncharacterized protein LOC143975812 [Lithobates pipiens]